MFAQDESARKIYLTALAEGSAEALFIRVDIVGKDSSGKSSLRKSLTNQKFNSSEPSTVGVEFDKKCEIIVSESCNWTKSLSEDDHLKTFEKILASDVATRTRFAAMSVVEVETNAERKAKRKRRKVVIDVEPKPAPKREKVESATVHKRKMSTNASQDSCHKETATTEITQKESVSQEQKLANSIFDQASPEDSDSPVTTVAPVIVKAVGEKTSSLESKDDP